MSLILLGLVILASASQTFHLEGRSIFIKQLTWLGLGVLTGGFAACLNLERLREYTPWITKAILVLLVLVLIPGIGISVNGSQRWLGFSFIRLQPSGFAKIGLVLFLAYYLAENQREIRTFVKGFLTPCAAIGVGCLLILLEPDFGTAFLCAAVGLTLLFVAGVRLSFLLPSIALGLSFFGIAIALNPNRLHRLLAFMDVQANRLDGTYQLWQGILAFGAGGWNGVGLGNGRQQMAYLPEAHTDFIFSVIGEELGFTFTALAVLLFLGIFLAALYAIRKAPNIYYFSLAFGIVLFITLQSIMNLGVVTGLFPTKGISLPFISYGGSNLLVMCTFIGLLLNCFATWEAPLETRSQELLGRSL